MDIYLYKVEDDDMVLNKALNYRLKVPNIKLKSPTNINNPTLMLSSKIEYSDGYGGGWSYNTRDYNYCFIPEFERYYFIDNVTIQSNNITVLNLRIDVLKSYEEEILNSMLYVEVDDNIIIESDVSLEQEFSKILVVKGGVYSG